MLIQCSHHVSLSRFSEATADWRPDFLFDLATYFFPVSTIHLYNVHVTSFIVHLKDVFFYSGKNFFKCRGCFKEAYLINQHILKTSQRRPFVRHGCLKDVFCTLWMTQRLSKNSFVCYGSLKDVFLYVMDVSKMSFLRYECLKDVFFTLWMPQRRHLYFMNASKTSLNVMCVLFVMDVSDTSLVHWNMI